MKVRLQRLAHAGDLPLPRVATEGSSGADLRAAIDAPVTLDPGARALVATGFRMQLPAGTEAQVRPRSGLALRHGVTVLNSPGTIDCDYRGEVKVILINLGQEPYTLERGDRMAQLVVQRVEPVTFEEVDELAASERGAGGFGSSGTR